MPDPIRIWIGSLRVKKESMDKAPKRIMLVYGTRPEAIKMAPVLFPLERSAHLAPVVVLT